MALQTFIRKGQQIWWAIAGGWRRFVFSWAGYTTPLFNEKPWLVSDNEQTLVDRVLNEGDLDNLKALHVRQSARLDADVVVGFMDRYPDRVDAMFAIIGHRLSDIPRIETVWENAWKSSVKPERMEWVDTFLRLLARSSRDPDRMLAKLQCGHNPWRLDVLLEQGPGLIRQQGGQPRQLLGSLGRQAVRVAVRELNFQPLTQWIQETRSLSEDLSQGADLDMIHDGGLAPALVAWHAEWRVANQYVRTPDIQALKLLLKAGAMVNVHDRQGQHLIERLMVDFECQHSFSRWPEERESFNTVMDLLVWQGANWLAVNQKTRKACPKAWEAMSLISPVRKQRLDVIGGWGRGAPDGEERRRM